MFRKAIIPLMAAAVAAVVPAVAHANINVQLTITATQPALIAGTSVTGGTWSVFATVTGSTATLGLAGIQVDVTGDGNVSVFADTSHKTRNDLPSTPEVDDNSNSIATGFSVKKSAGTNGIAIAGYQDPSSYQLIEGADDANDQTSILTGVGITVGSQTSQFGGANSWALPVKVADGFYQGTLGDIIVSGNISFMNALPATIPALDLNTESSSFQSLPVDSVNNVSGTGSASAAIGVATPEPASLGVLALGGLALLARRRKTA